MPFLRTFLAAIVLSPVVASAAEIAVLNEATWAEFAPQGKEVDAIYGDIVIRNDKLVAVIANPIDGRNANMTVKNVGGCLIDFTTRDKQNDQLQAYYPLGKTVNWRTIQTKPPLPKDGTAVNGSVVSITVSTELRPGVTADATYELSDAQDYVQISTWIRNKSDEPIKCPKGELTTQGAFIKGQSKTLVFKQDIAWTFDRWWRAAYGTLAKSKEFSVIEPDKVGGSSLYLFAASELQQLLEKIEEAAESTVTTSGGRLAGPTENTVVVQAAAASLTESQTNLVLSSRPIADAYVEIVKDDLVVTAGFTDANGTFTYSLHVHGSVTVSHPAFGEQKLAYSELPTALVRFNAAGKVAAAITDERGGPIPCKVKFTGIEPTNDPIFWDKTGDEAVGNLYYSHNGKFALDLPPGKYDVCVSHGPEYDIVEQKIEVLSGSQTPLSAKLVRSVQTPGWISGDFHNHASPSGDNTSSQFGRVLNLLAEQVEFAPCTEHNRVSSYLPHLQRLKAEHLMATCSGIELTGSPFSVNHHNAFPMKLHEHKQDGGGPTIDADTEVSVERLALWDDRSHKLIQQNHPDIGYLFFDKNGDGMPDEGYQKALGHLDCIEVHPPHFIFDGPHAESKWSSSKNNPMFNWLQLLNQGYRIPGVVNTDAHYNIHGSGWLRNYIECTTDDPAKIDIAEMVHAAEHGHMVMTNAPYLEVSLQAAKGEGKQSQGGPGDDVVAPDGKATLHVRVQCANWYDIDRVQVFVNGKADPKLNFTRKANPDLFTDQVVKFERDLPLELTGDAHVIVAAIGENSGLGHVMGPEHEKDKPTAVANPIFVDVDGGGFKPNKDTLGAPLPVKAPGSK